MGGPSGNVTDACLGGRPTSSRPGRRGRRAAIALLIAFVVIAAVGVSVVAALDLRGPLLEGRAALESGKRALLAGRFDEAVESFEGARVRFDAARERAASGPAAIAARVPILGRTIRVLAALADAASLSAEAGVTVSSAVRDLPGGLDGLISSDRTISLAGTAALSAALAAAADDVAAAAQRMRSSPGSFLPGPVASARRLAIDQLEGLEDQLGSAVSLSGALPSFAGADGLRRYLFLAENPAELRGTGGLWGAYAIVQARAGRFTFSRFRPIQSLDNLPPKQVPAPNPDYRRNYGQYGAPGYWLSLNMTPDLPSAATAALSAWRSTGHSPLDGVITADPFALRELLTVTGRVRVPAPTFSLTAENVVPLLTNRAFARFSDPAQRKAVLGEAARAVLERFLRLEGRAVMQLRALGRAISEGHLKLFSVDPAVQSAFTRAGVDAGLHADGGDLMAVIVNSGAGGKVDYFATRTVRHEVLLLPGGGAAATTSVTIENDAPTSGQPAYVIGPHVGEAGDNIPLIAVYCGSGCRLVRAERDGRPISLRTGSELGFRFFRDYFTIPSGRERTLTVSTEVPNAWDGSTSSGSYRLSVLGQTTIRPTEAVIRFLAPAWMRFTGGSEGVTFDGDRAIWSGVVGDRLELEVSFEQLPLFVRLWRSVFGDA
jgi:hypothetical protein